MLIAWKTHESCCCHNLWPRMMFLGCILPTESDISFSWCSSLFLRHKILWSRIPFLKSHSTAFPSLNKSSWTRHDPLLKVDYQVQTWQALLVPDVQIIWIAAGLSCLQGVHGCPLFQTSSFLSEEALQSKTLTRVEPRRSTMILIKKRITAPP